MHNRDTSRLLAYHEATKHTAERLRAHPHWLDWDNMPDPFRHYEGAPVVDLPAEATPPAAAALTVLAGQAGTPVASNGADFLSSLLFHSAAISASKRAPATGHRYALRVNPSSGNLHPTEFHFATLGLSGWDDGLYHYRPSSHTAEQRAVGDFITPLVGYLPADVVFVLTSIAWREAWKYRNRAYRYCLHDIGHAWQSLALAARSLGCDAFALGHFCDDAVSSTLRLAADEWPMLLVCLRGCPLEERQAPETRWTPGCANRLSAEVVPYGLIDGMHASSKLTPAEAEILPALEPPLPPPAEGLALDPTAGSPESFATVARRRRSALDFAGGARTLTFQQLSTLLDCAAQPLAIDPEPGLVHLYLYVHRVDGLEPGVYRFHGASRRLEMVRPGDQRVAAAGLSLGQDLAGNACVAFSMIADLQRAARVFGNRGYRYAHFEAGAIGQRLYLAAEALGFQSTGIGAFFDDQVHHYLGIRPSQGQVVYHFACGFAVPDTRIEG